MLVVEEDNLTGIGDSQDHELGRKEVLIPQQLDALRAKAMSQPLSSFHLATFQSHPD